MFTSYTDVRDWLENFIPQTYTKKELGLERIKYLLKLLGNPQNKFKSIHIAGTSGKGSTAFYTARLLQLTGGSVGRRVSGSVSQWISDPVSHINSGTPIHRNTDSPKHRFTETPKIGLHISPHLVYIGERMQISGKEISVKRLIRLMSEIKPVVESMKTSQVGLPSYFEILVAASFLYFAQEKVDIAVVEVGLGGRLDATNVLRPEVSVITNVGLDHSDILGKTIEKIAFEKAGIIKKNVPIITMASSKALEVIKKIAKEEKTELITKSTLNKVFGNNSELNKYKKLYKKLLNNGFAFVTEETFLLSCATVSSLGISLTEATISEAFSCPFAGRFEEIDENVVVDGAHNLEKIQALVNFLKNQKPETRNQKLILVVAFKKGKDWKGMIDYLFRNLDIERCIATQFYSVTDMGFFSSVDPEEIADYVQRQGYSLTSVYSNSHEAVFEALRFAQGKLFKGRSDQKSLVLVTGSLYLVGEVRAIWYLPEF